MKPTLSPPKDGNVTPNRGETDVQQQPARRTLGEVASEICADAKDDSLKYILRSDTGHDGE